MYRIQSSDSDENDSDSSSSSSSSGDDCGSVTNINIQCFAGNVAQSIAYRLAQHHFNKVGNFLQALIDENILTKSNRIVRKKLVVDLVKTGKCQYSSFETMVSELGTFGFLESVSKRLVVFAEQVYGFNGLKYPKKQKPRPRSADGGDSKELKKTNEVVYTKTEAASNCFDSVPDKKLVEKFVQFLVRERILSGANKNVRKIAITEALEKQKKQFKLTFEELLNGLNAYGFLKSESKRFLLFSQANDGDLLASVPKKEIEQDVRTDKVQTKPRRNKISECKDADVSDDEMEGDSVSTYSDNTDAASLQQEYVKHNKNNLEQFLQYLIDESILTKSNRTIQTKIFTDVLKEKKFQMFTFGSLTSELHAFGLLDSVSKKWVIFSELVFEMPNLDYPFWDQPRVTDNQGLKDKPSQQPQNITKKAEERPKPVDIVPDKELVKRFVKLLQRTQILTNTIRNVKKSAITDALNKEKKNFKLPVKELLRGLHAHGYLETEYKRSVMFLPSKVETESRQLKQPPVVVSNTQHKNAISVPKPVANTQQFVCKPDEVSEEETSEDEISEAELSDIEMEEEFQSAGSTRSLDSEEDDSDDHKIQEIVQCLIDEAGLAKDKTTIKRSVITSLLDGRCFNYTYDELVNEFLSFGYLNTVSRRFVVFSDMVFDLPDLQLPAVRLPRSELNCDLPVNDCLYDSDDMNLSRGVRNSTKKTDLEQPMDDSLLLKIEHNLTFSRLINRNFTWSSKSCIVCQKKFLVEMQLEDHLRDVHGEEFTIPDHLSKGTTSTQMFSMNLMPKKKTENEIFLMIRNNFFMTLTIKKIFYVCSNQYMVISSATIESRVQAGETFEFALNRNLFRTLNENHSILLVFEDDIEFIEHYNIKTVRATPPTVVTHNVIEKSLYTNRVLNAMKMDPLSITRPAYEIVKLFNHGFHLTESPFSELEVFICKTVRTFLAEDPKTRLNAINYIDFFSYCIQIADCGQERDTMIFDRQQKVPLMQDGFYRIDLIFNDMSELPPDMCEKDLIALRKIRPDGDYLEPISEQVLVSVHKLGGDHLLVENVSAKKEIDPMAVYNIRFKDNRIPIRMEHQALKIVERQKLAKYFFPTTEPIPKTVLTEHFEWFNSNISTNLEQMQAVKSIVNSTAYPSPYIIFGPPGTGKTSTIVETICQLWKIVPNSRILVTAQSNSACDEITKRLIQILPKTDIYRIFAPCFQRKLDRIDYELQEISNLKTGQHQYPSWDELYGFRIVVCTLITSGRLVQARIDKRHFTHVFIDECASASEPSALIPIAGIITGKNRIYGNIILAGDIQQLGPTLKSRFAHRLGYDKPMMERLMELPIYQKDPKTNKFNPNLMTKLIRCFRSHPKIIEFSNKKFYDSDLLPKGLPELTHWATGWRFLPNKNFPVIFVPCYGESMRDEVTYSTYNESEIAIVMNYVKQILSVGINNRNVEECHIGVISPYKKQCLKIAQRFDSYGWQNIEVGTVETFQGREKPIIIISTVKSGTSNVGFLNNPKRLNVTITRAKALMIIIGNPDTLRNDPNWYDLMYYCQSHHGCVTKINLGERPAEYSNTRTVMADFNYHIMLPNKNQNVFVEDFL